MTLEERSTLVLAFTRVLYVNGQDTDQTLDAAERLGDTLRVRSKIMPRWGELQLQAEDRDGRIISAVAVDPAGVEMDRVASTMRAIEELGAGRLAPAAAMELITKISKTPPAPTWLFTLAAAAGAVALAVRYQLSSSLRLVAVCPCMILVPGPHVLNGALDLIRGRIHLGATRLIYAGLVIVAISTGLLLGLTVLGVSFPVDPAGRAVPLWLDTIAAGVAVAAYSVFFSTPLRMLPWPVAVGMLAHALRWVALTVLGSSAATGALVACLIVGLILTPVTRRWHMPFAAIGFASVVSMIPGVFLFRMASGLVQLAEGSHTTLELISATTADGMIAVTIILAMSFGLIIPKLAIDRFSERATQARP